MSGLLFTTLIRLYRRHFSANSLYVPTQSLPVHLIHCVYLDFPTDDPCIFVAYYYSSAVPIEHVSYILYV